MDLDPRQQALLLARGRAVFGLVLLVAPGLAGRTFLGKIAREPAVRATLRIVGIRDLLLGIGALTTVKERSMDAEWVGVGAIADAVDALVLFGSPGLPFRARLGGLPGAGGAIVGMLAARQLADDRGARKSSEINP
jgi:hypothetical protein